MVPVTVAVPRMEANKPECEKCIKIAQAAMSDGNYEKAIKFLEKSNRLYPNDLAKRKLSQWSRSRCDSNEGFKWRQLC